MQNLHVKGVEQGCKEYQMEMNEICSRKCRIPSGSEMLNDNDENNRLDDEESGVPLLMKHK